METHEQHTLKQLTIHNKNDRGALCDIQKMLEIRIPIKYIGCTFTYFCYHTEYEELASIS